MRIRIMLVVILFQMCDVAATQQEKSEREAREQIRILLDWSTHNVYGTRELQDRCLKDTGAILYWTFNWPSKSGLEKFDVLLIDSYSIFGHPPEEIQAIKAFVERGGGLLLAGHCKRYIENTRTLAPGKSYPLNNLASVFGFRFTAEDACQPFRFAESLPIEVGSKWETDAHLGPEGRRPCVLKCTKDAQIILRDAHHRPLIAAREFGMGRVVAIGDPWFFCHPDSRVSPKQANKMFILNVLKWLGARQAGEGTLPNDHEIRAPVAIEDSVFKVHAVETLLPLARNVYECLQPSYKEICSQFGYQTQANYHIFPWPDFPSGGNACSRDDGYIIAVGALCPKPENRNIMTMFLCHEIAHTFIRGRLSGLEESFASLVAYRTVISLHMDKGLERDKKREMRLEEWPRLAYERDDPHGDRIDLSQPVPPDLSGAGFGKGMWVIETLEERYGHDFMKRYFQLLEKEGVQKQLTMEEVVKYMSRIAGQDLTPWFKSFGTWKGADGDRK